MKFDDVGMGMSIMPKADSFEAYLVVDNDGKRIMAVRVCELKLHGDRQGWVVSHANGGKPKTERIE